jgi:hypothetical protein
MRGILVPLIALALAAGACSTPTASVPAKPAAVAMGTLHSAWGEMPTYQAEGNGFPFEFARKRPYEVRAPRDLRAGDAAILDVLVDRNGAIRDVKVQTSSGVEAVDRFLMNRFVGARSKLQLAATDAAPYVLRQTLRVGSVGLTGDGQLMGDGDSKFSDVRPMGTGARHPADR